MDKNLVDNIYDFFHHTQQYNLAVPNTAAKHQCGHFKMTGRPIQRGSHRPNVEQSEQ